jgi:hypothetical protein
MRVARNTKRLKAKRTVPPARVRSLHPTGQHFCSETCTVTQQHIASAQRVGGRGDPRQPRMVCCRGRGCAAAIRGDRDRSYLNSPMSSTWFLYTSWTHERRAGDSRDGDGATRFRTHM